METPKRGLSSISEFTAGPSRQKLDDISPGSALDRHNNLTNPHGGADTSFEGGLSIADRAKTRQRTQPKRKAPEISGDIIELTSEDEEPVPNPSKPKSRAKPQAKSIKLINNETPSTSHDTKRDFGNEAKPKPKPRPRPVNKRQRTDAELVIPPPDYPFAKAPYLDGLLVPQPPPTPPPASSQSHGAELPLATSPPRGLYSQLPPSDPPNPTMTTVHDGEGGWQPLDPGLPPIETLQDPDSDHDRPSSPSSLFSERGSRKIRKSKERPNYNMEVDELASSSPADAYNAPPRRNPPTARQPSLPPTFFAGSSSMGPPRTSPPAVPAPIPDVVDLTHLPPTFAPIVLDKTKPKAKKTKKKVVLYDEEFEPNAAPMMVLDEDDKDDDFDPTGEGGKKGKGKGKQKEKKQKEKKATGKKKLQVEVVIPAKAKGKGKQKEPKELNVFKSNEFVEDSDDDDDADPLRLVGGEDGLSKGMRDDSSTIHVRPPKPSIEKPDKDPSPPIDPSRLSKSGVKSKKSSPTLKNSEEMDDIETGKPEPVKKPRKPRKKATPVEKNDQTTLQEPDPDATPGAQVKITKEKTSSKHQSKIIPSDDEEDLVNKPAVAEPTSSLEKVSAYVHLKFIYSQ
ncbi:hypothetical protein CPB83DRAFT_624383 [Crepidotus variabilis]|uniref:Uncharacterized protein n=1 Tax=Crepidotus variabilis TaxID=179855 RepID=A0A9P6JSY6_9AGAR|nr:hypothetical protein CPB83DRAFT_624383 [Crepidotus variabilis]